MFGSKLCGVILSVSELDKLGSIRRFVILLCFIILSQWLVRCLCSRQSMCLCEGWDAWRIVQSVQLVFLSRGLCRFGDSILRTKVRLLRSQIILHRCFFLLWGSWSVLRCSWFYNSRVRVGRRNWLVDRWGREYLEVLRSVDGWGHKFWRWNLSRWVL